MTLSVFVHFEYLSGWVQVEGPLTLDTGQDPRLVIAQRWAAPHASPQGAADPTIAAVAVHRGVDGTKVYERTDRYLPAGNGDLGTPGGWVPA